MKSEATMDVEFWSARVQSAKHLAAMQSSRLSAGKRFERREEKNPVLCNFLLFFRLLCNLSS